VSPGFHVLRLFAPILILAGIGGFVIPADKSLMSGAAAYNVFHLCFGALGVAIVLSKRERAVAAFNVGFGLIDLYQAVASRAGWFPIDAFRWKTADDVLHVAFGLLLVAVGVHGWRRRGQPTGR